MDDPHGPDDVRAHPERYRLLRTQHDGRTSYLILPRERDARGTPMVMIVEDEAEAEACVAFLLEAGVPVLDRLEP